MFLKTIEIRGFKSFADKIELDFKKGVTAVVGPNGSGKSNISDAIRWVLGEQSIKTLRGGKMEDVIFAGTQYRKSVGLAQVVLTLDNSDKGIPMDYNEITIARRLYRSGESEYYINNTKCRLKDIQEMFMDTGIGKEGYSIIGQGKIEAVLSGKSEERRGLLEEAAGIVKFKTRKEEAEKKLESTEENLVRIDDILSTYEERLEPLKKESEKAKSFVKLSEELSKKEINLLVNSVEKLKIKIKDISVEIKNLDCEINKLNNERHKNKVDLKSYNESLYEIENLYKVQREEYYEKKAQYQSILSDNNLINEKIQNLNNLKSQYTRDLEQLRKKVDSYLLENKKCTDEYLLLKNTLEEYNEKFNCIENNLEIKQEKMKENEGLLKKYKDEEFDTLGNVSDLKNLMIIIKRDIESYDLNINQIKSACESYSSSIKINTNTKISLENELSKIKVKIEKYELDISENKRNISKISRILSADERLFNNLNAEINKLEANKNMLNSLEDQYEGYNKSVKNLMIHIKKGYINKENKKCIVLGDSINVEKRLEIAIEIALGSAISNIITEDEILAKDLIKYLKYNKLGRATFLPLNILQNKKFNIDNSIKSIVGYIGIASELIEYDSSLTKAIEHVLGRTLIAENMNSALEISKKSNFRFKIVTLSGEVVNPGGALTGGSIYKKNFNIIGRKREIQELDSKIISMKEEINKLFLKNKENANNIKKLDDMNLNLKDSIHFENIEITKIQSRITSIDIESKKLNKNYSISVDEINILHSKKKESTEELTNKQKEIDNLEEKQKKLLDLQKRIEDELINVSKDVSSLKENITSIKIEKAKLDESSINKKREINRLNEEIAIARDKCQELESNINNFEGNFLKFKDKLKLNKEELKEIEEFLSDMDVNFQETEINKINMNQKIKYYSDKIEEFNILINRKEEERHKIQLSLTRLETESDALTGRLKEEFKLDFLEALSYKVEIYDLTSYKNSIREIKNNISKMGTVNVGSIEEYKGVKEKYNFMYNQREDLVKSKEEIVNVINEMTYKMKSVFSENFEKIRKNFAETFRELFKGGNADLILSGEDVLSSNIEINVEPPGKKLQNINLMSGGEKGLSAIALLFAILKMKPTPFCILDEIEAALDDANVARYADFLRKFSEKIQFIVITHRKGTMEASNILYGVTMEEKGVSKVVSVDLAV
ncbi:chromosome partition protein Smc [Clostridium pasteurianum DSM 525 = ATCC 6013]|uniref:Chromosome partition protein Smc n=1 Tax=Clostridium pasteurianum DSM 525 = ATCC 6013 TaxID=1262449 RepID=A0A0H3J3X4_CLOPA|nr:chromosome segregation protein SMC [Clostridium pasteurianum]AJA48144.1 chromosome partition protein Smc [Clostridium pasteurianum DSM 525 = ATCC 6013]AJA52132.1 chromosome partition protein Smc [Clostridium pasteurianum DSM 525 = ATCC 6013]AOZ75408.1 chromosome segregation protein SMC [Clostridium pasteurianum DSM 525 = ATCC 6013]AOZ79203.1 chromosome segregation protein SMC [Clostridium pasteurianum]ELP60703.1 chromosome segregation protein SMC [Clostridium pasteurianum DSM 525 = ATCC 601